MQERGTQKAFACRLPAAPQAVPLARAVVDGLDWLSATPERAFALRLLATEIVSNAVKHGEHGDPDQWIGLVVRMEDESVRIQVSDSGPGFRPHVVRPDDDDPSGRGLLLLDALSDRWGVRRHDHRTEVWFELSSGRAQDERATAFG
jgi:anti-sigma regulatory factor (Ser/Thr protein kinase)